MRSMRSMRSTRYLTHGLGKCLAHMMVSCDGAHGPRHATLVGPMSGGRAGETDKVHPGPVARPQCGTGTQQCWFAVVPARSKETRRSPKGAIIMAPPDVRLFQVTFPNEALDDLRRRIAATRWPSKELVTDRSQGVQFATIQELARYWTTEYDWPRCEARLNALPQFTTEIDGVDIHFIHVKSPHENALPLIMTHGWPGSVIELLEAIGPLTDPTAHGGPADHAFHLVLPPGPGYGWSPASRALRVVAARVAQIGPAKKS